MNDHEENTMLHSLTWEIQTYILQSLKLLADLAYLEPFLSDSVSSAKVNYKGQLGVPLFDQDWKLVSDLDLMMLSLRNNKCRKTWNGAKKTFPVASLQGSHRERLWMAPRQTHNKYQIWLPSAATQAHGLLEGSSLVDCSLDDKCSWEMELCSSSSGHGQVFSLHKSSAKVLKRS